MAPLIGLMDTVPPQVIERSRRTHKANLLAVANQFNRESQIDWEGMVRRFRILSLCAEGKNPLLWSHYADSHRGVAFEFDACDASFTDKISFQQQGRWHIGNKFLTRIRERISLRMHSV